MKSSIQQANVIWLTGLSGAGKTTLAEALNEYLVRREIPSMVLDGDELRTGLNKDLGFSEEDRLENVRRTAEMALFLSRNGVMPIISLISPLKSMRQQAKAIIGEKYFKEVYVKCPFEICESRDVKGLYKKARAGGIPDFTGLTASYEAPENPDLTVDTNSFDFDHSLNALITFIESTIGK